MASWIQQFCSHSRINGFVELQSLHVKIRFVGCIVLKVATGIVCVTLSDLMSMDCIICRTTHMEPSLKRCHSTLWDVQNLSDGRHQHLDIDRISSLPNELLSRILSLVPTKDAAAARILSRRMRQAFIWVTSLDLDDSSLSHCLKQPHLLVRTTTFKRFVDYVLLAFQTPNQISRFRLQYGGTKKIWDRCIECGAKCTSYLEPAHCDTWFAFLGTCSCLTELDLSIIVRNPGQLPATVFTCETLEVLKLNVCLDLIQVCAMPSFRLPNLKVFHLSSAVILEDDFLNRLLSSCPLLEDLLLQCDWEHADSITVCSSSLRTLCLEIGRRDEIQIKPCSSVHIDTPNLQSLHYADNLALEYEVTPMNALVDAEINLLCPYQNLPMEASFQKSLSLVRTVSNAQQLCLAAACLEAMDFGELKGQLPVFHNAKFIDLIAPISIRWGQILLEVLNCSPLLETLIFSEGLSHRYFPEEEYEFVTDELEQQCWRTTPVIPTCCKSHLKRIVIHHYHGLQRELDLVGFVLRNTFVLEELVVYRDSYSPLVDQASLLTSLNELPRGSPTCSIEVH